MSSFRGGRLAGLSLPISTVWLLSDIAGAKGRQDLYARQAPRGLNGQTPLDRFLDDQALIRLLAPSNESGQFFLSGRARFGESWFLNGSAALITMEQDDALLPYTLNNSIVGINFDGTTFDPTNPANLPARNADNKVDVMTFNAQAGTDLGESLDLTFRYRYYDYDSQSRGISLAGYVRFHGVREGIARITVPYGYTRQEASAELGWDMAG
ncbi:MAG TPA: MtrB/PioB family outer membrane beta-barrel protein [Thermoanaerobaculia bacterium]|nr:MtrB/PioB family outer membrane beta-barrel protein [Thermoanaerobaculia bacterium]